MPQLRKHIIEMPARFLWWVTAVAKFEDLSYWERTSALDLSTPEDGRWKKYEYGFVSSLTHRAQQYDP